MLERMMINKAWMTANIRRNNPGDSKKDEAKFQQDAKNLKNCGMFTGSLSDHIISMIDKAAWYAANEGAYGHNNRDARLNWN